MPFKLSVIFLVVYTLSGCTTSFDDANLLSIPVKNTAEVKGARLDEYRVQLETQSRKDKIYRIASEIWVDQFDEMRAALITINKLKTADDTSFRITVILDGFSGDSVRGRRQDIHIQKKEERYELLNIKESWRCWPDRGHQYFSTTPCS